MKTYLVTGAAGFIGANFVKYMLKKYEDIHIVILQFPFRQSAKTVVSMIEG